MASGRVSPKRGKVMDIPNPPTIGTATADAESATVAFTANSSGKGGPTFSYTALSSPGSFTGTGTTSPITVSGLTAGSSYTFTVAGVNPTGTSEYSAASNSITALSAGVYESIATVLVGSNQTTITFSSIPSTYKHLQVRFSGILSSGSQNCTMRFNSDTTSSNYYLHFMEGDGSSAYASGGSNFLTFSSAISTANTYSIAIVDILDYANTNKYKVLRSMYGLDNNSTGRGCTYYSGLWKNTNAIDTISMVPNFGGNWAPDTLATLYGIKG